MTWEELEASLSATPGISLVVPKGLISHPRDAGATLSIGLPAGQRADWRFPPTATCQGLHAQDFGDEWRVHMDHVHPACDPFAHLQQDAPGALVVGGLALGALVGRLVGGGVWTLVGAAAGLFLGAVSTPSARDRRGVEE